MNERIRTIAAPQANHVSGIGQVLLGSERPVPERHREHLAGDYGDLGDQRAGRLDLQPR